MAAKKIADNGHGNKSEWTTELIDAAKSGTLPIHEFLNGDVVPWIISTVKTAEVQKYLVEQYGRDLLTVKSSEAAENMPAKQAEPVATESAPGGVEPDSQDAKAGAHIGYFGHNHVQTWLMMGEVSPQNAALLFFGKNPSTYKGDLPEMGEAFDLMMWAFKDVARDGRDRNLSEWTTVARARNLHATNIDGWEACITKPKAAPIGDVSASDHVDQTPDPERRLARLRTLGGTAKYVRYKWKFMGMAALVAAEKVDNRRRRSEKTIRADLIQAAQAERDEKSAGFTTGLGQR